MAVGRSSTKDRSEYWTLRTAKLSPPFLEFFFCFLLFLPSPFRPNRSGLVVKCSKWWIPVRVFRAWLRCEVTTSDSPPSLAPPALLCSAALDKKLQLRNLIHHHQPPPSPSPTSLLAAIPIAFFTLVINTTLCSSKYDLRILGYFYNPNQHPIGAMLKQRAPVCVARFGFHGTTTTRTSYLLSQRINTRSYHSNRKFLRPTPLVRQAQWQQLLRSQGIRFVSGKPLPQQRSWLVNFAYRSAALIGGSIIVFGVAVAAFFLYDASTYREDPSFRDIQVSEIALSPRRGGPKNLPIAEVQIDDDDCAEMQKQKDKPKLVVLGGGWGSVALLKTLNPEEYHVTLVSPTNYFLFTPMLPSATVGTLEFRSLVEPIRRIVTRVRGHFLRASAENIEFSEKLVELSQKDNEGNEVRFYLPYDKLVIGVGSTTNPHGVTGLEHCHFLKASDYISFQVLHLHTSQSKVTPLCYNSRGIAN